MKNPDQKSDAVAYFAKLLQNALHCNASDLHLTVGASVGIAVTMRIDGVLTNSDPVPEGVADKLFGRIKYLAKMKTYQDNFPQDGRIPAADVDLENDIRVSSYPTVNGEKLVLRFFRKPAAATLEQLGYQDEVLKALQSFMRQPSGMLLLTGPAGSGKSTTIYAFLNELARTAGRHIVTIEDPVEQEIPGIMQTEINASIGLTFPEALKRLLRQDPEVIVIGEIRDEETAKIAIRSAFTGHLVIATLHAGSCKGVIDRLFDMVGDQYAVLSAVNMILNQRLLRKICHECTGKECENCKGSGYNGRIPVAEIVELDDKYRSEIRESGTGKISSAASLADNADALVKSGITDKAEANRLLGLDKK